MKIAARGPGEVILRLYEGRKATRLYYLGNHEAGVRLTNSKACAKRFKTKEAAKTSAQWSRPGFTWRAVARGLA